MQVISHKKVVKFCRKRIDSQQKSNQAIVHQQIRPIKRQLKYQANVINMMIIEPHNNNQQLHSLLFTQEKQSFSAKRPEIKVKQQSSIRRNIFLCYSPDTVKNSNFKDSLDELDILLEGYPSKQKSSLSTTSRLQIDSFSQNLGQNKLQKNILASFHLEQNLYLPSNSLRIHQIATNSFAFEINFYVQSQCKKTLSQENYQMQEGSKNIFRRMIKQFRIDPFQMFNFYLSVLIKYQYIQLRQFLLVRNIKFTTDQIKSLERDLDCILDICRGEQIMEFLFMTAQNNQTLIINLENHPKVYQIQSSERNFWKALSLIFSHSNENGFINFQMSKIRDFLLKLI